jgi:hypothetical protein
VLELLESQENASQKLVFSEANIDNVFEIAKNLYYLQARFIGKHTNLKQFSAPGQRPSYQRCPITERL